jgi:hypothetical protein
MENWEVDNSEWEKVSQDYLTGWEVDLSGWEGDQLGE